MDFERKDRRAAAEFTKAILDSLTKAWSDPWAAEREVPHEHESRSPTTHWELDNHVRSMHTTLAPADSTMSSSASMRRRTRA